MQGCDARRLPGDSIGIRLVPIRLSVSRSTGPFLHFNYLSLQHLRNLQYRDHGFEAEILVIYLIHRLGEVIIWSNDNISKCLKYIYIYNYM